MCAIPKKKEASPLDLILYPQLVTNENKKQFKRRRKKKRKTNLKLHSNLGSITNVEHILYMYRVGFYTLYL
jgi:hypothetical protein